MIAESAKQYLASTNKIRKAHLVEIELAGTDGVFDYLTDYYSDITFNGAIYGAGKVKSVGSVRLTQGITNYKLDISVAAEFQNELDKATTDNSYEGRKINVFRAYIDEAGNIIEIDTLTGGPLVLFQGYITNIGLKDAITSGSSTVNWSCAGLLYDFEKVNGRITDDSAHRALESTGELGNLVPGSGVIREAYKTDTGFLHSNQTISASLSYLTTETQYYMKSSFFGLKSSLKTREVEVEREVELNTSLTAKHLPVIYGVRKVPAIPVFLDAHNEDASIVYCVYAVCEGEIQSFLNLYVDGNSVVCSPGGNSAEDNVCMGNTANGDALAYYASASTEAEREENWRRSPYDHQRQPVNSYNPEPIFTPPTQPPTESIDRTEGTSHGMSFDVAASDGPLKVTFYHGKPDQEPDPTLATLASSNSFLLQNKLKKADGSSWGPEYWAPKSTGVSGAALLDTAYLVVEFVISEDRTTIPELEVVVEGLTCRVYTDSITYTEKHTLNPVWHLLDYCTNSRFGGELTYNDFDIPSLIEVAARLDTQDLSYEASYIKMWRYLGWEDPSGPLSKMQCNTFLDTSNPITKNVESILNQYAGTLIPLSGKYNMSVENDDAPIVDIPITDVVGGLTLKSKANKDKWNAIQASIIDPALNWTANSVSFFNSNYLEEDNNIRKQGRTAFSHITNYYTARAWAEYILDTSRFSKTLKFTTYYKYFYLKPNDNVTFTYPRYGYDVGNNKFRVVDVDIRPDGLIDVSIERYDPEAFNTTTQNEVDTPTSTNNPVVEAPKNLTYSNLPTPGISISTPPGERAAILLWDLKPSIAVEVLRYEVNIDGEIFQVSKDNIISVSGVDKLYFLVTGLPPSTTNEYKVCTVNRQGKKSSYSITVGTSSSGVAAEIPPIENLQLVNKDFRGNFTGKDATFSWDTYSIQEDTISGLQIEVLTSNGVTSIHSEILPKTSTSYTFSYVQNKSEYQIINGTSGAYRAISFRIRAISGDLQGESNVSPWRTV